MEFVGDGGKAEIRGAEESSRCDDDRSGLGNSGSSIETNGDISIGATGAVREISGSRGRKPVTHGKTLSFLIESLADQLKDSQEAQAREAARQVRMLKDSQEAQARDAARQVRIEQQLQQLQEALDAWRASVADVVEDSTNEA